MFFNELGQISGCAPFLHGGFRDLRCAVHMAGLEALLNVSARPGSLRNTVAHTGRSRFDSVDIDRINDRNACVPNHARDVKGSLTACASKATERPLQRVNVSVTNFGALKQRHPGSLLNVHFVERSAGRTRKDEVALATLTCASVSLDSFDDSRADNVNACLHNALTSDGTWVDAVTLSGGVAFMQVRFSKTIYTPEREQKCSGANLFR